MSDPAGVLLVDKPRGPSSHDVVDFVRWALRVRHVGHCGTLDPMATGLLVVCVGRAATRLVPYLSAADKRYEACFELGAATDTADADGRVHTTAKVDAEDVARARRALEQLHGELELPPPAYSAVWVDGRRAHELARAGEVPRLAPRPMRVDALDVVEAGLHPGGEAGFLRAVMQVSKGTYVRSLAVEIGRLAGLPVHLGALRRISSGPAQVSDPRVLGGLEARRLEDAPGGSPRWRIRPEAGEVEDRSACGARLARFLGPPMPWLPFETLVLHGDDELALGERLLHGQRLGGHEPGWEGLLSRSSGRSALLERGHQFGLHFADTLIVCRVEEGPGGGARIAPERTLRGVVGTSDA